MNIFEKAQKSYRDFENNNIQKENLQVQKDNLMVQEELLIAQRKNTSTTKYAFLVSALSIFLTIFNFIYTYHTQNTEDVDIAVGSDIDSSFLELSAGYISLHCEISILNKSEKAVIILNQPKVLHYTYSDKPPQSIGYAFILSNNVSQFYPNEIKTDELDVAISIPPYEIKKYKFKMKIPLTPEIESTIKDKFDMESPVKLFDVEYELRKSGISLFGEKTYSHFTVNFQTIKGKQVVTKFRWYTL